jgi:predicted peptidase
MSMVRVVLLAAMIAVAAPAAAVAQVPAGGSTTFKDDGPTPPAPPPPPVAAAPAAKETPRTDKPVGDYTKYYQKKDFTDADRRDITYYWRQPEKLTSGATYPLVIILHDEHGGALAGQYMISPDIQGPNPSFIAIPMMGFKKIWSFPSEFPEDPVTEAHNKSSAQALPEVKEFIDDIRKNFPVDNSRIYIVGCGDGGWGALGAVYNYPSEFAAAVSINGNWGQKQTGKLAKSKTAIFMENGADDKTTSAYLASVTATYIQQFKGKISFVSIPGGTHDCNEEHYYMKGVWKWMYAQHRQ